MAKLTLAELKTAAASYVDATKQLQATYTPTKDDFTNTMCKIGDMFTLYLPTVDKLPELDGDDLPFGQTVEEFMVNEFLPSAFAYKDGQAKRNAKRVTFGEAVYSYPLAEQLFEVAIPRSQFQRVALGQLSYTDLISSSMQTLDGSTNAWQYAVKRQMIGNIATEAAKKPALLSTISVPVDAQTGEAFIEEVKKCVEVASDMNEANLAGHVSSAAPSLKLYIKQGIMPSVEVRTLSGAFHDDKLAIEAETKVILDFGDASDDIFAVLVDPRGLKLRKDINYIDSDHDGEMGQDNYWRHLQSTAVISKYCYVHVFKKSA